MRIVAEKCGLSILMVLTAWLILFSTITRAEVISEHNAEYTAVDAARFAMMIDTNCTQTKTVLRNAEKYKAEKESGKYYVTRGRLEITCIQYAENKPVYLITWNAPTHREDGTLLELDEIHSFDIMQNGDVIASVPCCEYRSESIDSVTVRTVDTGGRKSKEIQVNLLERD